MASKPFWQTTRFQIDLAQPRVMGIVNVTPDSFSDGGQHATTVAALRHAERLVKEGADILDVGGESTRPGAPLVTVEEEWARIAGVLQGAMQLGVPVSVDTNKAEVMRRALELGVDIVNDVRALCEPNALEVVASHSSCGVCLMHMQGNSPQDMQQTTDYADVVEQVRQFLKARMGAVHRAGIAPERVTLDPGIGFGKAPEHNLELMRRQPELLDLGRPLLLGWSRKSTLGHLTGRPVSERLAASLAAGLASLQLGAAILRVHDVAETVDAIRVWRAAGLVN